MIKLLEMHGGCSAGTKFANVDPRGNVHLSVLAGLHGREYKGDSFQQIWNSDDPLMIMLRNKAEHLKGAVGTVVSRPFAEDAVLGPVRCMVTSGLKIQPVTLVIRK